MELNSESLVDLPTAGHHVWVQIKKGRCLISKMRKSNEYKNMPQLGRSFLLREYATEDLSKPWIFIET
jgi:hypothetical protein